MSSTITKSDIISRASKESGLSKTKTEIILNSILNNIQSGLVEGKKVNFSGFGCFVTSNRKPRQGRNPKTGQIIDIPASVSPRFRPGKNLKNRINI